VSLNPGGCTTHLPQAFPAFSNWWSIGRKDTGDSYIKSAHAVTPGRIGVNDGVAPRATCRGSLAVWVLRSAVG